VLTAGETAAASAAPGTGSPPKTATPARATTNLGAPPTEHKAAAAPSAGAPVGAMLTAVPGSQPAPLATATTRREAVPATPLETGVQEALTSGTAGSAVDASTASTRPDQPKIEVTALPTGAAAPTPAPALDRALAVPAPQAAAPAQTAAPTLGAQLARPVFTLAAAGAGEHVMTVHVTPDTLGPVTVRARVGGEGVRVELFAPTDAGRDALRAILPDLRRDLGGAGLSGTLDLSSQNQPSPQHDAPAGGRQQLPDRPAPDGRPSGSTASTRTTPAATADGSTHTIDLIV
jgi:flagellar hook-length control protein FliK